MYNTSFYFSMNIFTLILNSILLGVGLAMDAFSVSVANGLNEPLMKKNRMISISLVFGVFQTAMPLIGWFLVHTLIEKFKAFEKFIPWIALLLLAYIGIKMIIDGASNNDEQCQSSLSFSGLIIQGIATSIDALSVGFTIANYSFSSALLETIIIGIVTFIISILGIVIGKKFGTKFSNKASIFGGIILILIGLEIFITGVF